MMLLAAKWRNFKLRLLPTNRMRKLRKNRKSKRKLKRRKKKKSQEAADVDPGPRKSSKKFTTLKRRKMTMIADDRKKAVAKKTLVSANPVKEPRVAKPEVQPKKAKCPL